MKKKEKEYRRLTWPTRSSGVVVSFTHVLWLGKDHVLSIQNAHFREDYKRFYFSDIQALVATRTNAWIIRGLVLGLTTILLAGGFALMDYYLKMQGVGYGFAIVFGTIFGFLFLLQFLGGPTCKSYLQTAVHREFLPSVNRMRKARKVFAQLNPLIQAAQGDSIVTI